MYSLYHENFGRYVLLRCGDRTATGEEMTRFRDFISVMTHEVRNSLHGILVSASYLLRFDKDRTPEAQKRRSIAQDIESNAMILSNRLRTAELFAFENKQKERMRFAIERIPIKEIIREITHVYNDLGSRRHISIKFYLSGSDHAIMGDRALISTALANVVDNAVKYSYEGEDVVIRTFENKQYIGIEVVNVGLKIDDSDQKRIFEPFYRGKPGSNMYVEGTGLGLHIANKIMDTFNGFIEYSCNPLGDHSGKHNTWQIIFRLVFPKNPNNNN
jgi:signal transduction histidine kinase